MICTSAGRSPLPRHKPQPCRASKDRACGPGAASPCAKPSTGADEIRVRLDVALVHGLRVKDVLDHAIGLVPDAFDVRVLKSSPPESGGDIRCGDNGADAVEGLSTRGVEWLGCERALAGCARIGTAAVRRRRIRAKPCGACDLERAFDAAC